jgi:hypothetical protein
MEDDFADIEQYMTEPDSDAWHRWYVRHLRTLDDSAVGTIGVVAGSWLRLARPLATLIGGQAS